MKQATHLKGPLTLKDIDRILDNVMTWINDSEVVKNLARFNHRFTRREERKILRQLLKSPNDKLFAIHNHKGEYIGQIAINQIYWPARTGRLGIVISMKGEWGKGHAQRPIKPTMPKSFAIMRISSCNLMYLSAL